MNKFYLKKNILQTKIINREDTWLDTGTFDSLLEASQVIHAKQTRQGLKIGCIEEIAYNNNWISENEIKKVSEALRMEIEEERKRKERIKNRKPVVSRPINKPFKVFYERNK